MKPRLRASLAFACCACVAGCATPGSSFTAVSATHARDAITIGKSTKADALAALGKTAVVSFDSGFEVWAYQYKGDWPGKNEFVVLFAPNGIVAKTRMRPAPPPAP
jgi:hypothetical protein